MTEGPEWRRTTEGRDSSGKDRMDNLRAFFNPRKEADHPGMPLDAPFDLRRYSLFLVNLAIAGGDRSLLKMNTKEVEQFTEEIKERNQKDLEWFIQEGLLSRIEEDFFQLTELGKSLVRRN